MTTILRKLFWFALFVAFTIGFVTLFDHGYASTKQFSSDAQSEVHDLIQLWKSTRQNKGPSNQAETWKQVLENQRFIYKN